VESRDQEDVRLFSNEISIVIRGAGKGKKRSVTRDLVQYRESPDAVVVEKIPKNQALLYRLSGDSNPLHVDPEAARIFGLSRPILHGICTLGYASRMVLRQAPRNRQLRSVRVQFSHAFFPGETLETRIWKESDQRFRFCSLALERQKNVLSCGEIELEELNAKQ
jgi:3-hydroxyacyl-CoA dehydrogenase/3a,7a,12a-trihydroxy-5b-cholest-24-enoyl-CoA hydratase